MLLLLGGKLSDGSGPGGGGGVVDTEISWSLSSIIMSPSISMPHVDMCHCPSTSQSHHPYPCCSGHCQVHLCYHPCWGSLSRPSISPSISMLLVLLSSLTMSQSIFVSHWSLSYLCPSMSHGSLSSLTKSLFIFMSHGSQSNLNNPCHYPSSSCPWIIVYSLTMSPLISMSQVSLSDESSSWYHPLCHMIAKVYHLVACAAVNIKPKMIKSVSNI